MTAPVALDEQTEEISAVPDAPVERPPYTNKFVGVRHRDTVADPTKDKLEKEPPRFASLRPPVEGDRWHYAPGRPRPENPIKATISKVNKAEKFIKDGIKDVERKMRVRSAPPKSEITPAKDDDDFYVIGGIKATNGRPSIQKQIWDAKSMKVWRKAATTSTQLLLSGVYTMLGFAHEIIWYYLYKGWYDFAFKTLFLKEFLGGLVRLPGRLINGPDRRTQLEKDAEKELKLRAPSNKMFHEAALRARAAIEAPLTEEELAPYERTRRRLAALQDPIEETPPDVPRHAEVRTLEDNDVRRQAYAGAGDAPVQQQVTVGGPDDPNRRRRRSRGGGRTF